MKQAKVLFILLMLFVPMCAWTVEQGYAVYNSQRGTLTFRYGEKPSGWYVYDTDNTGEYGPSWPVEKLKKVVFEASFANARPRTTKWWFVAASELMVIEGLQYLNTSQVVNMLGMFDGCSSLTNLEVSCFDTSNVTDMNYMFCDCSGLKSLDVSHFNTSNVVDMVGMFSGCSSLTSLDLSSFNTHYAACNGRDDMFMGCNRLKTIYVSKNWGTECINYPPNVNVILASEVVNKKQGYAVFDHITGTLTFSYGIKPSGYNVYDTDNTLWPSWYECVLKRVVFNKSFQYARPKSTAGWFYGSELTKIEGLQYLNTSQVTNMAWMFGTCSSLTSLNLSHLNTNNVVDMKYMFMNCSSLINLNLNNFNTSNVTDMMGMFNGCSALKSLDLHYFDTHKVLSMEQMFKNCSSLTSLDLSHFDTNNVTDMTDMFSGCSALEDLDISRFENRNVIGVTAMFMECKSLTSLDLSNFNTHKVVSTDKMFTGCSGLTILDLSHFDTNEVFRMEEMFYGCSNLTHIYVGNNWSTAGVEYGKNMFTGCEKLVGGKGTKYGESHIDYTYARVDKGTSAPGYFTLAENKNGKLYSIGENSATVCSVKDNEEDVEIPAIINFDGTECPVTEIGEKAFESNTLMTELTIPETVTAIGDGAFAGCTSLEAIYCYATTPIALGSGSAMVRTRSGGEETSASSVFDEVDKETCILYVPQGCHDAYAAADGWCEFIHIEEMGDPLATGETFTEDGAIYEVLADGTVKLTKNRTIPENYAIRENVMHNGVKYKVTAIGAYAINKWELNMFTIPSTINDIGPEAIKATSFLETVISHIEEPFEIPEDLFMADVWDSATKTSTYIPNATLYVPVGTRDKYDAAGWTSHFAKVVEGERLEQFAGALKYAYATSDDEATVIQDKSYKDLTEVNIPATVTMGGKVYNVTTIGYMAFEKCSKLTSVALPEGLKKIGVEAFIYYLGDITLPSTLKTIGDFSFSYSGITTMVIPEGVESIETQALCYCRDLIKVVLPKSLKKIGYLQTNHSTNIKAVISYIEEPFTIGENTFTNGDGNSSSPSPATLYVPKGTKQLYETAGWTTQFATVKELVPGDADGDEDVDFDDIEITKNYIMTGEAEDFIFENADMNGDNEINAADIVKILNIIKSIGN